MTQSVYAVATMDTKGHELTYVAEVLRASGVNVVTLDVGTLEPPTVAPDVERSRVAAFHPRLGRTVATAMAGGRPRRRRDGHGRGLDGVPAL